MGKTGTGMTDWKPKDQCNVICHKLPWTKAITQQMKLGPQDEVFHELCVYQAACWQAMQRKLHRDSVSEQLSVGERHRPSPANVWSRQRSRVQLEACSCGKYCRVTSSRTAGQAA